ncbi:hypothetical protein TrVE_jg8485 [Triparma verrucosa]|uniref:Sepiapterin reductase n=1 Tax=Triparma verrucosa TaxID=1606542 RepID=A0A9W7BTA9_9STRA|nr:hypothetical protein TrVE_jg8485 [Triparma verrucosa]
MSSYTALITGSSRGFGKSLAFAVSSKYPNSTIYLLSRPSSHHTETFNNLKKAHTDGTVHKVDIDFNDAADTDNPNNNYINVFKDCIEGIPVPTSSSNKIVLYNNHGTLGHLTASPPLSSVPIDLNLNITSCISLSLLFSSRFPLSSIVNVSSLAALKPFPTWSLYCASKSARDMFHHCLSLSHPTLKTLSYAPGAMDTDMQSHIRLNESDVEMKEAFVKMKEEGKLVDPDVSARKCVELVEVGKEGHVDYWD